MYKVSRDTLKIDKTSKDDLCHCNVINGHYEYNNYHECQCIQF